MNEELNYQIIFNSINIILIILGWAFVFWVGIKHQRKLLKDNARMKIYEELYGYIKKFDEVNVNLGVLFNPFMMPFFSMKNIDKALDPYKQKEKAVIYWEEYINKINKEISLYSDIYIKLLNHIDMWISIMPKLRLARNELFEVQLKKLIDDLHKHVSYLQNIRFKEYDWKKWDIKEIEEVSAKISKEFDKISIGFVDDFMIEVHNELVYPVLKYKKSKRENFLNMPEKCEVLTKKGIEIKIINKK